MNTIAKMRLSGAFPGKCYMAINKK